MTDEKLLHELRNSKGWPTLGNAAADRIEALEAKLAKAIKGLEESQEEIDNYIRWEYPSDHPVHERYRKRDFAANPARIYLAELTGGRDDKDNV